MLLKAGLILRIFVVVKLVYNDVNFTLIISHIVSLLFVGLGFSLELNSVS